MGAFDCLATPDSNGQRRQVAAGTRDHRGMTTAAALEELTDRSRFELLGTSVLRAASSKYAGIIHTGLNAQGETIVSPVDGIQRVLGTSPAEWVLVQHTTTERGDLRKKWLHSLSGDVAKAAQEAQRIRRTEPDALITLVLTSNQHLSSDLVRDTHAAGCKHRLALDIWDQSRLAAFLDNEAQGHWLRKRYLGIEAERLSVPLLQQLGRLSLEEYRKTVLLPIPIHPVNRPQVQSLIGLARARSRSLLLLVAESGFGKSVVTAEVLARWLETGGLGLWLPPDQLLPGLPAGLDEWLHMLHPHLEADAGRIALGLAEASTGLLLCIDDLNRTSNPDRAFQRLLGTAAPSEEARKDVAAGLHRFPVTLLAPLRTELLRASVVTPALEPWIHVEALECFLPDEARTVLRAAAPLATDATLEEYRARLGDDPFLVGLFAHRFGSPSSDASAAEQLDDVIGDFVTDTARRAIQRGETSLLQEDVTGSLGLLARELLDRRNLRPSWEELTTWFETRPTALIALRLLAAEGTLCRLDSSRGLVFRHDRLLDYLLSRSVTQMLRATPLPLDILADPYFASVVGEAVASGPVPSTVLETLRASAPWTIFAALRFLNGCRGRGADELFSVARNWALTDSATACDSVKSAIAWSLLGTDSISVLPIVEALGSDPILCFAALRNGSVTLALPYFERQSGQFFEPGIDDALRDRVIEHAKRHYGPETVAGLRALAEGAEMPPARAGALLDLLGHFAYAGFDDVIEAFGRQYGTDLLPHALWAAVRCPLREPRRTLAPLLRHLAEMPVRVSSSEPLTERQDLMVEFAFACRKGVCPASVPALLAAAEEDPRVAPEIALMVEYNDDPDALEFVVRRGLSGIGPGPWDRVDSISDRDLEFLPRSAEVAERLQALWANEAEEKRLRRAAFGVWLRARGCADAASLRNPGSDSPFRDLSLQYRVKSGDISATSELISVLRRDGPGSFWWHLAHRVWNEDLRAYVREALGALADEMPRDFQGAQASMLAAMLVKIPVADAESVLEERWAELRFDPLMIQVAFRLGTPGALALAREAMAACPASCDVFQRFFRFGPWSQARADNPVTMHHLHGIEPYLDRMSADVLLRLARPVERVASPDPLLADWIREFVVPKLPPEDRSKVGAASEALVSALDAQNENGRFRPYLGFLVDARRSRTGLQGREAVAVLRTWLDEHATIRGLEVAGECLRYVGGRGDLEILDEVNIDGDAHAAELIKADARFAVMRRSLL